MTAEFLCSMGTLVERFGFLIKCRRSAEGGNPKLRRLDELCGPMRLFQALISGTLSVRKREPRSPSAQAPSARVNAFSARPSPQRAADLLHSACRIVKEHFK